MLKRFQKGFVVAATVAAFAAAPAWAEDLNVMLQNSTGVDVTGFYVSHTGTDDWEDNLLGGAYPGTRSRW